MKLNNNSIALFVKNIDVSKRFYTNLLNLEVEFDFGKNIVFKGGVAIWEINPNPYNPINFRREQP